mgnify:FL=1
MDINEVLHIKKEIALEKAAIINLLYTSNLIFDEMNAITKQFDISIQQFNVLRILNGANESKVNMNYIQNRMIHKMSNTTRLIDKLTDKELVERNVCYNNRRKIEVKISQKGISLLNEINNLVDNKEKSICQNLNNEELLAFNHTLNKLRTNE